MDVIEDSQSLLKANRNDFQSYRAFTSYFQKLRAIDEQSFLLGVAMAYSWMPTIPKIDVENIIPSIPALNHFLDTGEIEDEDVVQMVSVVNNSIVGASKLLHFIRPDVIPIWDSRVYRYMTQNEPNHHQMKKIENFLMFRDFCTNSLSHPEINKLLINVKEIAQDVTPIRSIELVMYSKGYPKPKPQV